MKRLLVTISLMTIVVANTATDCCDNDYSFYIKVGTGVSFSECAKIVAHDPPWNTAVQGYNADLCHAPIASFAVGCELYDIVDLEVDFANRSIFEYRKFQTPTAGGASYTREFDLDITSIFFNVNLLGKGFECLNWDLCCGTLYPIIGFGVGASNLLITNFRTTGLPPTGDSFPFASFSVENQYTLRRKFTSTLLAGFEYNRDDCWAISTGYRWFNPECFKGPRFVRAASGAAVDVDGDEWRMRFRANEWFIEFKIFI